jgi:hypothetical protein
LFYFGKAKGVEIVEASYPASEISMAPSLEVETVQPASQQTTLDGKKSITVEVATTASSSAALSTKSVPLSYQPKFELEDHPIDVVRKLRVSASTPLETVSNQPRSQ